MTQTLTGTYHSTVVLDQGNIGNDVYVSGTIQAGFYAGAGVFAAASVTNAYVGNNGVISGGGNGGQGAAADGIYLGASGTVINGYQGQISGGFGFFGDNGYGLAGGVGVDLSGGGFLLNSNVISGGNGGSSTLSSGGNGGTGVYSAAGVTLVTDGTITGGAGGAGPMSGGNGGVGVALSGLGTLVNGSSNSSAAIYGGSAGNGGYAVGGRGVYLGGQASFSNFGTVGGGNAGIGDAGGLGVFAAGASTIVNYNVIHGGFGYNVANGAGTPGGMAVQLYGDSFLDNQGVIFGGSGADAKYQSGSAASGAGGNGAVGVMVNQPGGGLTNSGTIGGGIGGYGAVQGGTGAAGVSLYGGGSVLNNGTIYGGYGGGSSSDGTPGNGGAGVYLGGGTLTNAGTITGGGADENLGGLADAVLFGQGASTLIVDPGAVFVGNVDASNTADDVLELSGTAPGSLGGIGQAFTDFTTINVDAGSNWTLGGQNTLFNTEDLNVDGSLSVCGYLMDEGPVDVGATGALQTTVNGEIDLTTIALTGGTLACGSGGDIGIGVDPADLEQGTVVVGSLTTLAGFGTIAGDVAGSGTLEALGGTLVVLGATAAQVRLEVAGGSTLELTGGGALGPVSGHGALLLEDDAEYSLRAGKGLKLAKITVGGLASLTATGTITGQVSNSGMLGSSTGELLLKGAVSGTGTFVAGGVSTLDFAGGLKTSGLLEGTGAIRLDGASTLNAGARISAATVVEAANLTLGKHESIATGAGQNFILDAASGATVTLGGAAGDSFTNAGSLSAIFAGTADIGVAFINAGSVSAGLGTLSFLGSVTNDSIMTAAGGVLNIAGAVGGGGTLVIGTGGTLGLDGAVGGGQLVDFLSANGTLALGQPDAFGGLIRDFGGGCAIDLVDTAATSLALTGGVLSVQDGTATVASLTFIGPYEASQFAIGSDGDGGTLLTFK